MTVYTVTICSRYEIKSKAILSKNLNHDEEVVTGLTHHILEELMKHHSEISTIHIWTNGPSSQYKNRYVFLLVPCFDAVYKVTLDWNYFATSHGIGSVDALGGKCPITPTLTSSSVHHSSHQLTTTFLSYYNVT